MCICFYVVGSLEIGEDGYLLVRSLLHCLQYSACLMFALLIYVACFVYMANWQ